MRHVIRTEQAFVTRTTKQLLFMTRLYKAVLSGGITDRYAQTVEEACRRLGRLLRRTLARHLAAHGIRPRNEEIVVWSEDTEIVLSADCSGHLSLVRLDSPLRPR